MLSALISCRYGDLALKTKAGQVAAIVWILVGLVACSLFVAVVSSVLTMACLSQQLELSGNQVTFEQIKLP